jgi:hypothetical protein
MNLRLKTNIDTESKLNELQSLLQVSSKAAVMRMAIAFSLRKEGDPRIVNGQCVKYDIKNQNGADYIRYTIFGSDEIYYKLMMQQHLNVHLSDDEFLLWWDSVVKHSISPTTKYFMYQIDKKHRDDMNRVLQENGLVFIEEIIASDSTRHENKAKAKGKRIRENYEAIQVFAIPQK